MFYERYQVLLSNQKCQLYSTFMVVMLKIVQLGLSHWEKTSSFRYKMGWGFILRGLDITWYSLQYFNDMVKHQDQAWNQNMYELWVVYCEYCGEHHPSYNQAACYLATFHYGFIWLYHHRQCLPLYSNSKSKNRRQWCNMHALIHVSVS